MRTRRAFCRFTTDTARNPAGLQPQGTSPKACRTQGHQKGSKPATRGRLGPRQGRASPLGQGGWGGSKAKHPTKFQTQESRTACVSPRPASQAPLVILVIHECSHVPASIPHYQAAPNGLIISEPAVTTGCAEKKGLVPGESRRRRRAREPKPPSEPRTARGSSKQLQFKARLIHLPLNLRVSPYTVTYAGIITEKQKPD